ncbi:tRNA-specific 2-thiouridylase MnmA-like [Schistocerca gregaria]|uniref:tRNA-specific 2-thiouridylase MnmA-like n=1 Tax=Schistocerca gregaria TaxID=7010 RepID=UPI00211E7C19|nr:tRNA-specific 2-thiouridylase MnmA-like [Schistocerca gregaria]
MLGVFHRWRGRLCSKHTNRRKFFSTSSPRVAVALSGGVDSSVAALLLKKQGYDVYGIFMKNWSEEEESICTGQDDLSQVDQLCRHLNIPYRVVEFQKEYWNEVFQPFLSGYERGMTPNPDVVCNREIKFRALTNNVFSRDPSVDYLATGHYAQLVPDLEDPRELELRCAVDRKKDQTYFLVQVDPQMLFRIKFPIGHLTKDRVRQIASENGLPTAKRRESMGLCFIGKRKFDQFLAEYLFQPETEVVSSETGKLVARKRGAIYLTIGQKVCIGGLAAKLYVVDKDARNNKIYVCEGRRHPLLYRRMLVAYQMNWFTERTVEKMRNGSEEIRCWAKIRHGKEMVECKIRSLRVDRWNTCFNDNNSERYSDGSVEKWFQEYENGDSGKQGRAIEVEFNDPQRAISIGQFLGLYSENRCIGGGMIIKVGKNEWTRACSDKGVPN